MRFQPIGLIIIITTQPAPALVFAPIDTFRVFGVGIELGHRVSGTPMNTMSSAPIPITP